jgi:protein-L-isoaspartate O-methyltransferase
MLGYGIRSASQAELVQCLRDRGFIGSDRLAAAMARVDRAKFLPESVSSPYLNEPVKITPLHAVSTPQFHAQLLSLVEERLEPGSVAIDVGTGTGYLAAVMAEMGCAKVFATEVDETMLSMASFNLSRYPQVEVVHGGSVVLPGHELFDAVIISPAFACKETALNTVGPRLAGLGLAAISARSINLCGKYQQLSRIQKLAGSLDVLDLMPVACELFQEVKKDDDKPEEQLKAWREAFTLARGRSPNKQDMMSDKIVWERFTKFSRLRKYQP